MGPGRHGGARYGEAMADPVWARLRFVRLRSPAAIRTFLRNAPIVREQETSDTMSKPEESD
jgi:hypothetical protein